MPSAPELAEYVDNLRALLGQSEARFGMMVERQVQAALLPSLSGTRVALEPHLWNLLVLLLDGHKAAVPPLDDAIFIKTKEGVILGQQTPRFPRAAQAVLAAFDVLREFGVYPRPKLK